MRTSREGRDSLPQVGGKGAKIGTNVRHRSWARARAKEIATWVRLLEKATQAYRRACRRLLSKADLRKAEEIAGRVKFELQRENLLRGNKAESWDEGRRVARKRIEREFGRSLRGYRRWKTLVREYRRERARLIRAISPRLTGSELHVDFGTVAPPDSGDTRVFLAPFTVFDVSREDASAIVEDRSLVVPSIGHIVNNVAYRQEDDGPIATDFYGINWSGRLFSSAACGVNFTTPRPGRLRIGAALRCFHSRISCALRDRFGISEAELSIEVRLIIAVIQPNRTIKLRKTILQDGLTSFGSDLSHVLPELDADGVHVIEATTDDNYAADAGVQILAGCEVFVLSEIDDMRAYVDALLWWRLEKLTVEVV